MAARTHYERAFEAYLRARQRWYTTVDQTHRAMIAGARLKSFDFILADGRGGSLLVDVKGRKLPWRRWRQGRWGQNWATRSDIHGLLGWETVFGANTQSLFVFAYWINEPPAQTNRDGLFEHQGRYYTFAAVSVRSYQACMKPRSQRWDTVFVPTAMFGAITRAMPAA